MRLLTALLLVTLAQSVCASEGPPNAAEFKAQLQDWCEAHAVPVCPPLWWSALPVNRKKEGAIICGFGAGRVRVCEITLWDRTTKESLRHEFAHFLTWLEESDPRLRHGNAFKRTLYTVGNPR